MLYDYKQYAKMLVVTVASTQVACYRSYGVFHIILLCAKQVQTRYSVYFW